MSIYAILGVEFFMYYGARRGVDSLEEGGRSRNHIFFSFSFLFIFSQARPKRVVSGWFLTPTKLQKGVQVYVFALTFVLIYSNYVSSCFFSSCVFLVLFLLLLSYLI